MENVILAIPENAWKALVGVGIDPGAMDVTKDVSTALHMLIRLSNARGEFPGRLAA